MRTPWRVVRDWFAFDCPDDSGVSHRTRFPHWRTLKAAGVARPVRVWFRVMGPWFLPYFVAPLVLPIGLQILVTLRRTHAMKSWVVAAATNPGLRPPSTIVASLGALVISAAFLIALVALAPTMNRSVARRHRVELLRLRRCPACLYDLTGLPPPPKPEQLTTCAECGGAWRLKE